MRPWLTGTLPIIGVDDIEVVSSSSGNKKKLAKSDFTKPVHGVEITSVLTPDARQVFTQLRQAFTKAPII